MRERKREGLIEKNIKILSLSNSGFCTTKYYW